MTVKEYAKLYRRSERTIKRWKAEGMPLADEAQMRAAIANKRSRLGVSRFAPKVAVRVPAPADYEVGLWDCVYFQRYRLQKIAADVTDADIKARLTEVIELQDSALQRY
jgi:hypothetical protein